MDEQLKKVYTDAFYPSKSRFTQKLRQLNIEATPKQIDDFLFKQAVNQVHHPAPHLRYNQRHITASGINQHWQIDLLDYSKYSTTNKNFNFILVAVDVFSRFAYAEPIKKKEAILTRDAFDKMITTDNKPFCVYHDKGKEWLGEFDAYCKTNDIVSFTNELHDHHALGIIDRFSRTIKSMIEKYTTGSNTTKYIDKLPKFIEDYNHYNHDGIQGIKPDEVADDIKNQIEISNQNWEKEEANKNVVERKFDIQVGDYVRISIGKNAFDKGYVMNYTTKVYRVMEVDRQRAVLDNGKPYLMDKLLKVPEGSAELNTKNKDKANEKAKAKRRLAKEGLD